MKGERLINNWKLLAGLYFGAILLFATLCDAVPNVIAPINQNFLTCFYFSVITITTVGYGDVVPVSGIGKVLAATEAILGIVLIGLFLNSFWQAHIALATEEQRRNLDEQEKLKNMRKLKSYYGYVRQGIFAYKVSIAELTTPLTKRKFPLTINPNFKVSDLQDMYKPSLVVIKGFSKSTLEIYLGNTNTLVSEFKFMLANFDFDEFPDIYSVILGFLTASAGISGIDALLAYKDKAAGPTPFLQIVEEAIRNAEATPNIGGGANILDHVTALYGILKAQIQMLLAVENGLDTVLKFPAM